MALPLSLGAVCPKTKRGLGGGAAAGVEHGPASGEDEECAGDGQGEIGGADGG